MNKRPGLQFLPSLKILLNHRRADWHLNLNDAHAEPMANAFDLHQVKWAFDAVPPEYLKNTRYLSRSLRLLWAHPL